MILCDFTYTPADEERYTATCTICGRVVRTRTTKAVAACRSNSRKYSPEQVMQAAGAPIARPAILDGPGTELKALLKDWLGIEADSGCQCNSMAARMDALGAEWCETDAGLAEILGVMQAEHGKRWADGRTRLPWTDFGAKQLVRLACRRARAKAQS
jgi:hypothetical protein